MDVVVDITTPRLHLRNLREEDVGAVMEWATDADVVRNFSFFERGVSAERIRAYIDEKTRSQADLLLAVFQRHEDGTPLRYAGNVGLHEWDEVNLNARLGIILRREVWGHHVAQEAICALVHHAFTQLGLHKVYLNVFTTNERGIHLYEKVGFQREGVMRGEYRLRGGWQDMVRMGVLAPEWPTPAARELLELA